MKNRIIAIILTLLVCVSVAVPAFAAENQVTYVVDELDLLYTDELAALNTEADGYADTYGVDILFAYTMEEDLNAFSEQLNLGKCDDKILMVENEDSWDVYCIGDVDYIDEDAMYALRDAYDAEATYYDGVAAYLVAAAELVAKNVDTDKPATDGVITDGAVADESVEEKTPRLLDLADLLTDAEEKSLTEKMDKVGKEFKVELAIVTVDSIGEMTKADYAKKVYTESGFGFGANKDGVLLLINMDTPNDGENRGWQIYGKGLGANAVGADEIEDIGEAIKPDLKAGNYADAINTFADECEHYIDIEINGEPFDPVMSLAVSFGISLLIAIIVTSIMKGKLKSVRAKYAASDYVRQGSMNITNSNEFFLYRTVERREKPKSSSSDSSSGSRESTGGGSF